MKGLKDTLRQVTMGNTLNYTELSCLLVKIANIINDRPLGLRRLPDTDFCQAITPNMLILGRTSTTHLSDVVYQEQSDNVSRRAAYIKELMETWWNMWFVQCFDGLVPYQRQTSAKIEDNVCVGDVCLLKYQGKIGRGDYRLCRVVKTFPDDDGLVRKVEVEMRPKNSRDPTLPYISKDLVSQIVTVQRLVKLSTKPESSNA